MIRLNFALCILLALGEIAMAQETPPTRWTVYIGTSTSGTKSEGIYRSELDLATGKLTPATVAAKTSNPTFLAIHPSGKFLYSCGAHPAFAKMGSGAINAFAIEPSGDLTFLNAQASKGGGPCHIVTDKAGKFAFAANYGGGSACALPIGPDGKLGEASGFAQHKGKSVNKARQNAPHAHSINLDAANKFAFVADLGLDKVLIYKLEAGKLVPNDPAAVALAPGAGPRHFAFHPSGKFAFVNNELDSTVTVMSYDASKGELKALETLPTLPKADSKNSTAEVAVHPSGKFVYVSNRGHNSIATFRFDEATGKLTATGHQGKGVNIPRNFAIEPTGKYCVVANQNGHDVIVFAIDAATGALAPTEARIEVRAPMCIRFLRRD